MEKNEFYVEFDDGRRSAARGASPGISYLSYSKKGYYLTIFGENIQYFASDKDAAEACKHLIRDSAALKEKMTVTVRKGENTVCYVTSFRAFPAHHDTFAPTPHDIQDARLQATAARTVDFKAQEEEHAAAKLPEMERSLIAEFAERCKMGFAEYGPVFLGKRNWGKELKEEALDGLFYALMAAKTMEKYGNFIKALEEASDDELSMDACSPDPLKQATYLLKQANKAVADLAIQVADSDMAAQGLRKELASVRESLDGWNFTRDRLEHGLKARCNDNKRLRKALKDEREAKRIAEAGSQKTVSELAQELADSRQEASMNMTHANALKTELERRRHEYDGLRAAMESALSLGSPRG